MANAILSPCRSRIKDFSIAYLGVASSSSAARSRSAGWGRNKTALDKLCGVSDWRLHDLRRTVSTQMNELAMAEPHIVEAVLGHTVRGVAGVYNRAKYEAGKRAALEAWGAHVLGLVGGKL